MLIDLAKVGRFALLLLVVLGAGCVRFMRFSDLTVRELRPQSVTLQRCDAAAPPLRPNLAILADTQLHNLYGGPLAAESGIADSILARVAIRPTELNLFASVVLEADVRELRAALQTEAGALPPLLLFLGDAGNVSCTNEMDRFVDSMHTAMQGGGVWLAVHGNHDSFMMGNISSYRLNCRLGKNGNGACDSPLAEVPGAAAFDLLPQGGTTRPLRPVSQSEASCTPREARMFAYQTGTNEQPVSARGRSWGAACADPKSESVPMDKAAWLRRYLGAIEQQGGQIFRTARTSCSAPGGPVDPRDSYFNSASCEPPRAFYVQGAPDSRLAQRNYQARGMFASRSVVGDDQASQSARCPAKRSLEELYGTESPFNAYRSFIVQAIDISPHVRAILIDTVHQTYAIGSRLGERNNFPNAYPVIHDEQMEIITDFAEQARAANKEIVLVGHHPLGDFNNRGRNTLDALLSATRPIAYLSGHTHFPTSVLKHELFLDGPDAENLAGPGGQLLELNVGSTTDWPMDAALLSIEPHRVAWQVRSADGSPAGQPGMRQRWDWLQKLNCPSVDPRQLDPLAYKRRFGNWKTAHQLALLEGLWCDMNQVPDLSRLLQNLRQREPSLAAGSNRLVPNSNWWPEALRLATVVEEIWRSSREPQHQALRHWGLCLATRASRIEDETRSAWFDDRQRCKPDAGCVSDSMCSAIVSYTSGGPTLRSQ